MILILMTIFLSCVDVQKSWLPAMVKLGYTSTLPCPVNDATEAFMASIKSTEIHKLIQESDEEAIQHKGVTLLETLGIEEWTLIFGLVNDCNTKNREVYHG